MKGKRMGSLFLAAALLVVSIPARAAGQRGTGGIAPPTEEYLNYWQLSEEERAQQREPLSMARPSSVESGIGKRAESSSLPAAFDAREKGYLSPVRDQGNTGTCWTISSTGNLESFLNMKQGVEGGTYRFSPRHMEFSCCDIPGELSLTSTPSREADSGGNQFYSSSYYIGGMGPVEETGSMVFQDYPLGTDETPIISYPTRAELLLEPKVQVTDYAILPSLDEDRLSQSRESLKRQMKQAVLDYGSLDVGIDWEGSRYFNEANNCYYNPSAELVTNHGVLLVGWDDDYPRENFKPEYRPLADGAWIIQNSWGADAQDQGFFYVSYEELSIYELSGTVRGAVSGLSYDKAYVLDLLGQNLSFYPDEGNSVVYAANIFDKEPGRELLTQVNLGVWGDTKYEVYVTEGSLNISGLSPVASGNVNLLGYHNVELASPVTLTGNKFAVIVKYTLGGDASVPVESRIDGGEYAYVDAPEGSSFFSENLRDGWTEISAEDFYDSNFCIKAFTQSVSGQTVVRFTGQDSRALYSVYRPNGVQVDMRADGSFLLTQGQRYVYESSLRTSALQPDGSHVKTFMNSFTVDSGDSMTVTAAPHNLPFTDVSVFSWYFDPVLYCYGHQLVNGVSATRYDPSATTSRAELATLLWRMEGKPQPESKEEFLDVDAKSWYGPAVSWAKYSGVVSGVDNEHFAPNGRVTREQLAAMLYRYAGSPTVSGSLSGFSDAGQIQNYAKDALRWAVEKGIVTGKENKRLDPGGNATRAEVAAMLQRFCKSLGV